MSEAQHTPGPWPYERIGDGKRIVIGYGLVDGPNGYEVAEVYSDDCDQDEALANARVISAAPDLLRESIQAATALEEAANVLADRFPSLANLIRSAHLAPLRAAIARATEG